MSYKPLGEIMVITKKPKGSMSRKRQLDSQASSHARTDSPGCYYLGGPRQYLNWNRI